MAQGIEGLPLWVATRVATWELRAKRQPGKTEIRALTRLRRPIARIYGKECFHKN